MTNYMSSSRPNVHNELESALRSSVLMAFNFLHSVAVCAVNAFLHTTRVVILSIFPTKLFQFWNANWLLQCIGHWVMSVLVTVKLHLTLFNFNFNFNSTANGHPKVLVDDTETKFAEKLQCCYICRNTICLHIGVIWLSNSLANDLHRQCAKSLSQMILVSVQRQ